MNAKMALEHDLARISFRWDEESLIEVKQACRIMGIPLAAFLKFSAYEKAKILLREAQPCPCCRAHTEPKHETPPLQEMQIE